jgi:hypothetical protein
MRRLGAVTAVVLVSGGLGAAVAFGAQSPKSLRASMFAAARAERTVHYVTHTAGNGAVVIVADAGRTRGIQRIRYASGGKSGRVKVVVANNTAYVHGDAFTLHGFLGLPQAQAARYANVWIRVPQQSHLYAAVADAVTLPSFLSEIYPKTDLALVSKKLNGVTVVGVRGLTKHQGIPFVEAVYTRAGGKPLPVGEVEATPGAAFRSTTAIGRWNEKLRISVPQHAVPIVSTAATTA